jgi:hypothetical protein
VGGIGNVEKERVSEVQMEKSGSGEGGWFDQYVEEENGIQIGTACASCSIRPEKEEKYLLPVQ